MRHDNKVMQAPPTETQLDESKCPTTERCKRKPKQMPCGAQRDGEGEDEKWTARERGEVYWDTVSADMVDTEADIPREVNGGRSGVNVKLP